MVTTLDKRTWDSKEKKLVKEADLRIADYKLLFETEYKKSMEFLKDEKRRVLYQLIRSSLGDHYSSAAKVAEFANPSSLLQQVLKFMPADNEARRGALICKFWESKFEDEGENDIQVWINYISTSVHDLGLLGEVISETSKVARLQAPLPLAIFSQYIIANSSKGLAYKDAVEALSVFSQNAAVASQLKQLSTNRRHRPEGSVFGAAGQQDSKEPCRNFARGTCRSNACKYSHDKQQVKQQQLTQCKHCNNNGHNEDNCWTKYPDRRPTSRRGGFEKQRPKANASVLQIVQEAVDNKRQTIDVESLVDALQQRNARLFTFKARNRQAEQEQEQDLDLYETLTTEALQQARRFRLREVDASDDEDGIPVLLDTSDSESDASEDEDDEVVQPNSNKKNCNKKNTTQAIKPYGPSLTPFSSCVILNSSSESSLLDLQLRSIKTTLQTELQNNNKESNDYNNNSDNSSDNNYDNNNNDDNNCNIKNNDSKNNNDIANVSNNDNDSKDDSNTSNNKPTPTASAYRQPESDSVLVADMAHEVGPSLLPLQEFFVGALYPRPRVLNSLGENAAKTVPATSMSTTVFAKVHAQGSFVARLNMLRGRVMSLSKQGSNSIVLDGGANLHITNATKYCHSQSPSTMEVMGVTGTPTPCTAKGNLHLQPTGGLPTVILSGAHVVADFPYNFISESLLTDKDCTIIKKGKAAIVLDPDGQLLFRATNHDGLFFVDGDLLQQGVSPQFSVTEEEGKVLVARSYTSRAQDDLLMQAHRRHSHMEMRRCAEAAGLTLPSGYVFPICDACVLGKSQNHPHHKGANLQAQRRCQYLHFDFCGPFPTTGLYGERYILAFIDGYTGFVWDYYPAAQTEFFTILQALLLRLDNEFGVNCVSVLRSDNAKVFKEAVVVALCEGRGIIQQFSAPHSQWQNGKVERFFDTFLGMLRPSLFQSGLNRPYWPYAAKLVCISINRTPVDKADNVVKNFPPEYSKLERLYQMSIPTQMNGVYPFGILAFKHIASALRNKLDMKAKACIYLGIDTQIKGAVMLPLDGGNISTTAVFTVNQGCFPLRLSTTVVPTDQFKKDNGSEVQESPTIFWPSHVASLDHLRDPRIEGTTPLAITTRTPREWQPSIQALENIATSAEQAFRTGKTLMFSPIDPHVSMDIDEQLLLERRPGADFAFIYSVKNSAKTQASPLTRTQYQAATPSTFLKSKASPHARYWALARKREVISNLRLETLGPLLREAPPGKRPLPTSFVYKNKWTGDECLTPDDLPEKSWKARVVVKGYLMVLDRDYHETFAPTASASSIRLIAAIAANYAMPLKAADFETAFLNSPMDTVVYVTTPAGFEQWAKHGLKGIEELPSDFLPGDEPEPVGCRLLLKGIPGIKQGSRLFYQDMRKFWLGYGFTQLPADPCVFYRINAEGLTLVGVWVDDLIAAVPNDDVWNAIIVEIRKKFPVADKGKATLFLGMDIVQSDDFSTVTVSQKNSIEDLLERAGMTNCNPAATPCVAGMVWTKQDCPEVVQPAHPEMPNYRGVVALALFISNWTVPTAVFTVNKLCKYMGNPGDKHVAALKRLLRYFASIKDHGLVYTRPASPQGLVGFSDSSHMDCPDTSRSTVAFVFFFNDCVISWYSKIHGFVTTCTNHSEYAALFLASKEAFHLIEWLRPLQDFLSLTVEPTTIFLDNDGARALSHNPVGTALNKHVRMMHHFTQELVAAGTIKTCDVDTTANRADVFTKALGPQVFPTHALHLASDTTAAQALSLKITAPPAHVMMIRGVERSAPSAPHRWMRPQRIVGARLVASVGVQTDDLPSVASVGAQSDSSGPTARNAYFRQATDALYAALEYQEEVLETVVAAQAQNKRVRDASRALHARLQGILDEVAERRADEDFKDYQYPEPSGVGSPEPSEVESPELECYERPLDQPSLESDPRGVPDVPSPSPLVSRRYCNYCCEWGHEYSLASCVGGVEDILRTQGGHLFAPRVRDDGAFLQVKRRRV